MDKIMPIIEESREEDYSGLKIDRITTPGTPFNREIDRDMGTAFDELGLAGGEAAVRSRRQSTEVAPQIVFTDEDANEEEENAAIAE